MITAYSTIEFYLFLSKDYPLTALLEVKKRIGQWLFHYIHSSSENSRWHFESLGGWKKIKHTSVQDWVERKGTCVMPGSKAKLHLENICLTIELVPKTWVPIIHWIYRRVNKYARTDQNIYCVITRCDQLHGKHCCSVTYSVFPWGLFHKYFMYLRTWGNHRSTTEDIHERGLLALFQKVTRRMG